jgi:hypothetical protein
MSKLIDLNSVSGEPGAAPEKNFDWLEIVKISDNTLRFGIWEIIIKTLPDGTQLIKNNHVSLNGLFAILDDAGFAKRYRPDGSYTFIRVKENILTVVKPAQIKDYIIDLVETLPETITVQGFKLTKEQLKEVFLAQHHILFGENTLSPLKNNTSEMLSDTPTEMFFPYLNTVVKVTRLGVEMLPYSELKNLCIWDSHIIQRTFEISESKAMFENFIINVCAEDSERIKAMRAAFGYAMHRYYNASNTRAIVLYDEQVTDSNSANGGTGKSLAAVALSKMRETETIDGKKFNANERFSLQRVTDSTEIVFFDDILPDFQFERFNSILTNGWETEQKNKTALRIELEHSPKMIIASNKIMKTLDGNTASRRQYILEFGDYYSSLIASVPEPIVHVHGCTFFRDWSTAEWNAFDNYMVKSCIDYLANGLPLQKTKNVEYNRLLQNTSEDFVNWVTDKNFLESISGHQNDYHFNQNFIEFKSLYYGESSQWSSSTFGKWLKLYAKTNGFEYETHRINTVTYFYFKKK